MALKAKNGGDSFTPVDKIMSSILDERLIIGDHKQAADIDFVVDFSYRAQMLDVPLLVPR